MTRIAFDALNYLADQRFAVANYVIEGDDLSGWRVHCDGALALELGPGYRLLRTSQCGICSTDLARHFLPFPLPQVIGHEVIATDDAGNRFVVEINASHKAREVSNECAFCTSGLATHCPDRLVLGIHDLPGGFGPWILAPTGACLKVPDTVPDSAAVLVEPFAAALHGVETVAPRNGDQIAVLGPRRLGMLVVAALAGVRKREQQSGKDFSIAAIARDPAMLPLAESFGATETHLLDGKIDLPLDPSFDVVIDTTGNPQGLATAIRLAKREVHLKSTHGQPSCGLSHLTELVVDELSISPFPTGTYESTSAELPSWLRNTNSRRPRVAWLASQAPPSWLHHLADIETGSAKDLANHYFTLRTGLPRADVAVVDSAAQVDAAIRPLPNQEQSLVKPRGAVLVHAEADVSGSVLLDAVLTRSLSLTSSRCGDFQAALNLLASNKDLQRIGDRLVTHHFAAGELKDAFAVAGSRACIKAVITHTTGVEA